MDSIEINEKLLPLGSVGRSGRHSSKSYIVLHEASCTLPGAGAKAHQRYFENLCRAGVTALSYHYIVDSKEIIRLIPDCEQSFHAGDGAGKNSANVRGISVLLCVNEDSDQNETRERAAALVARLMMKNALDIHCIRRHFDFGGKECPRSLRHKEAWDKFIRLCAEKYEALAEAERRFIGSSSCQWYKVQICASKSHEEALELATELRGKGYLAYVVADVDYDILLGEADAPDCDIAPECCASPNREVQY